MALSGYYEFHARVALAAHGRFHTTVSRLLPIAGRDFTLLTPSFIDNICRAVILRRRRSRQTPLRRAITVCSLLSRRLIPFGADIEREQWFDAMAAAAPAVGRRMP
jgi:hypothetical protein